MVKMIVICDRILDAELAVRHATLPLCRRRMLLVSISMNISCQELVICPRRLNWIISAPSSRYIEHFRVSTCVGVVLSFWFTSFWTYVSSLQYFLSPFSPYHHSFSLSFTPGLRLTCYHFHYRLLAASGLPLSNYWTCVALDCLLTGFYRVFLLKFFPQQLTLWRPLLPWVQL